MRLPVPGRMLRVVFALLAWAAVPASFSAPPALEPPSSSPRDDRSGSAVQADPEDFLQQALDLERRRDWSAAIEKYQDALELWPSRTEFNHRRRLCETHYRLVRRYQDQSFRRVLLRLPREKALDLYGEILERIETHYVDPVPLAPLLRRGFDNLEVALRDPAFLQANLGDASAERVDWLRQALRGQRGRLPEGLNRAAARERVLAACELAGRALALAPAPVILEFAYGACDALDDYTSYLTPDKLDDLYAMIDGNFVGLGVELKVDPQGLRIVGVIRGGPAWEAGIRAGDRIVGVAGRPVRGLSLDEAASRLQGEEGTTAEIAVLRRDGSTRDFRLTRRHVEVQSVAQARIVNRASGVGYLHLSGFQKDSAAELDRAITALRRQGMRSLIIDLRGNPGGLLNVAVEIAERFINEGVIVSTRGRAPGQSQVFRAHDRAVWSMPLFVLIDHESASASEILAGALKDHHRALVVGQRSYGKGSVQSIFSLRTAPAGLKLTTAKFYSPGNRPYSEQGVEPDVQVQVAAKPAEGPGQEGSLDHNGDDPAPEGDLTAADPVLEQAVLQAKRRSGAAR